MQNFMKTIINALRLWVTDRIKSSKSDWNVNDPDSDNYVKNRTHYEEERLVPILEEQKTYVGFDDGELSVVGEPVVGTTYTVTYNGTAYECVMWAHPLFDGMPCLGNGAMVLADGIGEDVPFVISNGIILVLDYGTHTISITSPDGPFVEETEFEVDPEWVPYTQLNPTLLTDIPKLGDTYRVVYDGVPYDCVAWNNDPNNEYGILIGNGRIDDYGSGGEDVPFILDIGLNGDGDRIDGINYIGYCVLQPGPHTISIDNVQTVVHTLDEKYLPKEYATAEDVDRAFAAMDNITYTVKIPNEKLAADGITMAYDQCKYAYERGYNIIYVKDGEEYEFDKLNTSNNKFLFRRYDPYNLKFKRLTLGNPGLLTEESSIIKDSLDSTTMAPSGAAVKDAIAKVGVMSVSATPSGDTSAVLDSDYIDINSHFITGGTVEICYNSKILAHCASGLQDGVNYHKFANVEISDNSIESVAITVRSDGKIIREETSLTAQP